MDYVIYGEHHNRQMTEIKLRDVIFIENDFDLNTGKVKKIFELSELQELEGVTPCFAKPSFKNPIPSKF